MNALGLVKCLPHVVSIDFWQYKVEVEVKVCGVQKIYFFFYHSFPDEIVCLKIVFDVKL